MFCSLSIVIVENVVDNIVHSK